MDDRSRTLALQRRRLLALPPAERADALLAAPRPAELVRLLPAQELFLTLVEAGLERGLPLLTHATTPQVEFLFDVDAWSRDRFEAAPAGEWIAALHEADPEALVRWLRQADESLVVLALTRLLHVYKLDESADPAFWPPDRPLSTLDGTYYVEPRDDAPEAAVVALWQALTRLRALDRPAYEALLEQVLWAVPPELEEGAFEKRTARLAERGFPEFDEAIAAWAAAPDEAERLRARLDALPAADTPEEPAAVAADPSGLLPALREPGLTRLGAAALALPPADRERLLTEIVRLGNRFAVASLDPLGDPATHHAGLATALGLLHLGLRTVAGDRTADAARALAALAAQDLARAGAGEVQRRAVRARALASGWLARVPRARERLETAERELLEGLLRPRPVFVAEGEERPFREPDDLARADAALTRLEALGRFVEAHAHDDAGDADWGAVALTAIARAALGEPPSGAPLRRAEAAGALRALLTDEVPRRTTARFDELARALGLEGAAESLAARLADEFSHLPPDAELDPRSVAAFRVT